MFESYRKFACKQCGYVGRPKRYTPGNFLTELILWCLMILPGLIYSLWRGHGRKWVCARCDSSEIFGVKTFMGKKILAEILAQKTLEKSMIKTI